jgi:hypothetical protein
VALGAGVVMGLATLCVFIFAVKRDEWRGEATA